MKFREIYAYLNEDGTYRVDIKTCFTRECKIGKEIIKEIIDGEINIERANIKIEALNDPSANQIYTVTLGGLSYGKNKN